MSESRVDVDGGCVLWIIALFLFFIATSLGRIANSYCAPERGTGNDDNIPSQTEASRETKKEA